MNRSRKFAGFRSDFKDAEYVLAGIPFDKTSSFRTGARKGPYEIRDASYCFEPYIYEHGVSIDEFELCDRGNLEEYDDFEDLRRKIEELTDEIVDEGKFPIFLGGEHSVTVPVVTSFEEIYPDLDVLVLDAHLDFRDSYERLKYSHATVSKRISEIVGLENIYIGGVRSISAEGDDKEKPDIWTAEQLNKSGNDLKENVERPIYLSLDMDVFDPAFAPGVGNPEPFGLTSHTVKELISEIAPSLVGMDIVETNPEYDHGEITSNLAARLVYEVIGKREKKK